MRRLGNGCVAHAGMSAYRQKVFEKAGVKKKKKQNGISLWFIVFLQFKALEKITNESKKQSHKKTKR